MRQIQNGIHANKEELILYRKSPHFVSGGQATQMIIGATPETDYQILNVAESRHPKQIPIRCSVDLHRKTFQMPHCPVLLGI